VISPYAAAYSAFGMLNMELGRDFARSIISRMKLLDLQRVNELFAEMEVEARQVLSELGIPAQAMSLNRSVDLRYVGQFHEVEVTEVPLGQFGPEELKQITEAFHRRHKELFTFNMLEREVEFLNLRLKATAREKPLQLAEIPPAAQDFRSALKRSRPILWSLDKGFEETPVFDGTKLAAGHKITGPAIIEEPATTVVIPVSYVCAVDSVKNYILTRR